MKEKSAFKENWMGPDLDGSWGSVPRIVRMTMKPVRIRQREVISLNFHPLIC
jgi:hypothetical protein